MPRYRVLTILPENWNFNTPLNDVICSNDWRKKLVRFSGKSLQHVELYFIIRFYFVILLLKQCYYYIFNTAHIEFNNIIQRYLAKLHAGTSPSRK